MEIEPTRIIYCYLGIAEVRTLQQCLFLHFQANTKTFSKDWVGINGFLSQNCIVDPGVSPKSIYIKFVEVERDFLSAGSLVECLEKAIGYPLKFNNWMSSFIRIRALTSLFYTHFPLPWLSLIQMLPPDSSLKLSTTGPVQLLKNHGRLWANKTDLTWKCSFWANKIYSELAWWVSCFFFKNKKMDIRALI